MNRAAKGIWAVLLALAASPCCGADLNAEQVRAILAAVAPGEFADLSGQSLESLDLSNLDFKRANLSGANLFGAKLGGRTSPEPTFPARSSTWPGSCGRISRT